tara:strand:- start:19909 stop:20112 length:204 start_codon:yes stop_codon:yes gene_type:complete
MIIFLNFRPADVAGFLVVPWERFKYIAPISHRQHFILILFKKRERNSTNVFIGSSLANALARLTTAE